jgi:sugar transferase (PEP-CTERM/EpsH1 system associated)
LYLSHCVPYPPDKGEKIRAYHEIAGLAERYRLHLVCFARDKQEMRDAEALTRQCVSVYAERLLPWPALARAAIQFAGGRSLNSAFYYSRKLYKHVAGLSRRILFRATVVYTAVMSSYAPKGVPLLLDMVDVDSEKWLQYARIRFPGFLYATEARRLRRLELNSLRAAGLSILSTENEAAILRSFAPGTPITHMENGVDEVFFDGNARPLPLGCGDRRFVLFVGTMDYLPNVRAAVWFARRIFPQLRRRQPQLEFFVVGRNPCAEVVRLKRIEGVHVLGAVPDVRPYLAGTRAVVAPLDLARGIQNKVLEALAMGRPVFASHAVCRTFGSVLPPGVVRCETEQHYVDGLERACRVPPSCDQQIRRAACARFSWQRNVQLLVRELADLKRRHAETAGRITA